MQIEKWFRRKFCLGISKPEQIEQLNESCRAWRKLCDGLKLEIDRLHKVIAEPKSMEIRIEQGSVVVECEHWAAKWAAASFAETLGDAENWRSVEIGPMPSDQGMILVTVKRARKDSPEATVGKLREEIVDLKRKFHEANLCF